MVGLSVNQFHLVTNVLSFTIAAMGIAGLFFLLQRAEVLPRYRTAITLLGLVALVSTYNYVRIYMSWHGSFTVVNGALRSTGVVYDDTYRYTDWLITVPLLLVALVCALDLSKRQARLRSVVLALLAAEMVVLGFPGQAATDVASRWLWWGIAMVPLALIVFQLFGSMASAIKAQPPEARRLTTMARLLILLAFSVYPAIYLLPLLNVTGPLAVMISQLGFAAADLVANVLGGIVIYMIASSKTFPEKDAMGPHASALRSLKV